MLILAVLVVLCLVALAVFAWREHRLSTAAYRDRPATLEGGGSHLSVKR